MAGNKKKSPGNPRGKYVNELTLILCRIPFKKHLIDKVFEHPDLYFPRGTGNDGEYKKIPGESPGKMPECVTEWFFLLINIPIYHFFKHIFGTKFPGENINFSPGNGE